MARPRDRDELRAGNGPGQELRVLDRDHDVLAPREHERRVTDGGKTVERVVAEDRAEGPAVGLVRLRVARLADEEILELGAVGRLEGVREPEGRERPDAEPPVAGLEAEGRLHLGTGRYGVAS